MNFVEFILLLVAATGHLVFWVAVINRLHSCALPRWLIAIFSGTCWSCILAVPMLLYALAGFPPLAEPNTLIHHPALQWYFILCWFVAAYAGAERAYELIQRPERSAVLLSNETRIVNLVEKLGKRPVRTFSGEVLSKFPGNQVWQLRVQENAVHVPRMDAALDGLSIAHLSDLHMSGRLDKEFYQEIVSITNDLNADIITVTGDIFDHVMCWEWIEDTLGQLRARYGVYFVLGNHDLRVDSRQSRKLLEAAGLVDLGGKWKEFLVHDTRVVLAGNELPWFTPAADMETCPRPRDGSSPLRVLLSHSPDQMDWAQRHGFDLMLAGHTHGGQVRLPLVGAIVAPSRLGTKYTAGTFYASPTVMHVSSGVSGLTPLRWNCPPELTRLVLRCGTSIEDSATALAQVSV